MFKRLLVANRGEIACRIIRSARKMGIQSVAVYSDADERAIHTELADEAVRIGPALARESYLSIENILRAIRETGAEAVHPGYGFLSENVSFVEALTREKIPFIGPHTHAIRTMGDKIESKRIAREAGTSTIPGYMGVVVSEDEAVRIAREVGYPVMIKASAGGGGKGMRIARNDGEAREGFRLSRSEAAASFGDDRIFIEKYIDAPRHIEIQILADTHGNCVHFGERECSVQRRNQKVIEEAPSPFLDERTRTAMGEQAVALARAVNYCSAGTVEFIVDGARNFFFLEMNTRLQVEHPVTELVYGVDLVEQMIRVAAGERIAFRQKAIHPRGWAMESRLYAEDPVRGFLPSTGRLTRYRPPPDGEDARGRIVRNDSGVEEGSEISVHYDPMIAKLCTWEKDRARTIDAMRDALDRFEIEGLQSNIPFLSALYDHPRFVEGDLTTGFIADEWPEGFAFADFEGKDFTLVCDALAHMGLVVARREAMISGQMRPSAPVDEAAWHISLGGRKVERLVRWQDEGASLILGEGVQRVVESDWRPGQRMMRIANAEGGAMLLRLHPASDGWIVAWRGFRARAYIRTAFSAMLAARMPEKENKSSARHLLSPMPGLLVSLEVGEGESFSAGQPLAVIEAMKMENILRAERNGTVSRIAASAGDSLSVDQVIMSFA